MIQKDDTCRIYFTDESNYYNVYDVNVAKYTKEHKIFHFKTRDNYKSLRIKGDEENILTSEGKKEKVYCNFIRKKKYEHEIDFKIKDNHATKTSINIFKNTKYETLKFPKYENKMGLQINNTHLKLMTREGLSYEIVERGDSKGIYASKKQKESEKVLFCITVGHDEPIKKCRLYQNAF